jgi:23S rRNA (guanosine2251-2'-O)-methyltransferase
VFGARAVIAPRRHAAPETGALAKAASGALERQPYLRPPNLARAMASLSEMGYALIGLDGAVQTTLSDAVTAAAGRPLGLVLGAEGPGLRQLTRENCDLLARIDSANAFASLNVSNAAAVALSCASAR